MSTTPQFSIREPHLGDAEAIGIVHTESWKTTYKGIIHQSFLDGIKLQERIAGAKRRLSDASLSNFVLVENSNAQVVGFAVVGPCREKNVDADGELYAIYLLQEFQGQGGGKLLCSACIDAAKARSFSHMMVSVLEQNHSTRRFYESMGAKYIGADHVDIEEHRYPTATYLWDLSGRTLIGEFRTALLQSA